jgi:hypothetical protein
VLLKTVNTTGDNVRVVEELEGGDDRGQGSSGSRNEDKETS